MLRQVAGHGVYVGVLSAGRPERVASTTAVVGPATWHVPPAQAPAYQLAPALALDEADQGANVSLARNAILDAAFAHGATAVLLDDDVEPRITRVSLPARVEEPISFTGALALVLDRLDNFGLRLAAVSHVTNSFYVTTPHSTLAVINGGLLVVRPTPLRFDPRLTYNEDVDYALQHVRRYGGALRVNDVLVRFARRIPGGVRAYATPELEEASRAEVLRRYPDLVRPAPRAGVAMRR